MLCDPLCCSLLEKRAKVLVLPPSSAAEALTLPLLARVPPRTEALALGAATGIRPRVDERKLLLCDFLHTLSETTDAR